MGAFYACLDCDYAQATMPVGKICPKCGERMTLEDADTGEDDYVSDAELYGLDDENIRED